MTYVGEFGLDASMPWYTDRAPETGGGQMRDVIIFRLVPTSPIESEGQPLQPGEEKPRLNAPYVPVPEDPQAAEREVYAVDPDLVDRGRRGHRQTQNLVAEWAETMGYRVVRPAAGEPPFDVGWWDGDNFHVVEVKSLTARNEVHQLRLGLGQVLEYSHRLDTAGIGNTPILAVEQKPSLDHWSELCSSQGVRLIWPSMLDDPT